MIIMYIRTKYIPNYLQCAFGVLSQGQYKFDKQNFIGRDVELFICTWLSEICKRHALLDSKSQSRHIVIKAEKQGRKGIRTFPMAEGLSTR